MKQDEYIKKMSKIVARTWHDEAFKQALIADPVGVLKAEGVDPDPRLEIRVLENTNTVFNLVLPVKPDDLNDMRIESDFNVMAACQFTAKTWSIS